MPKPAEPPPRVNRVVMDLQGADGFAAWAGQLSYMNDVALLDPAELPRFSHGVEVCPFGASTISTTRVGNAQRLVRTETHVAQSGLSHLLIQHYVDATWTGRCRNRQMAARPGDVGVLDLAQPYDLVISPGVVTALVTQREDLPPGLRDRDLHGLVASGASPAGRLLAETVGAFARVAPTMSEAECRAAQGAVLMLAEPAFARAAGTISAEVRPSDLPLRQAAQAHVEAEIADPDLSAEGLAANLQISRSALYRLFASEGGVGAYVRERRLLRAYEIIGYDLHPDASLREVAFAQGFKSEAQFSRAFKARFGVSPSAARRLARTRRRAGLATDPAPVTGGLTPLSHDPARRSGLQAPHS